MTNLRPDLYNSLDRGLPVVLLPVRLEMRFGTRPAATSAGAEVQLPVLRLRIYPDDISIDDHQQDLTEGEVTAGRAYWARLVDPNTTAELSIAKTQNLREWELLTRLVGTHRATYVAEMTRNPAIEPPRRTMATPATAELLPDHWAVTGWVAGQRVFDALGSKIRHSLAVGPTPRADGQPIIDPDSTLPLDKGSRWLADYEEAVAAGMAVTIDLVTPDALAADELPLAITGSIDRLFVFGVRESLTEGIEAEREAASLGRLIQSHRAVHGAGFLPQGTPTNNLGERRTAWSSRPDPYSVAPALPPSGDAAAVNDVLRGFGTNAQATETALGLTPGLLNSLENAEMTEQHHARLMNEVLFPVTWGELIGTLFLPSLIDSTTDKAVITALEQARAFARSQMLDFVRARGPLPVLRIGKQPYGILPITDSSNWAQQSGEFPLVGALSVLLSRLRPFWEFASGHNISMERELPGADAATRRLTEVLGQGPVPHPASYGVRTVTGELASLKYRSSNPSHVFLRVGSAMSDEAVAELAARTELSIYRRLLGEIPALPKRSRFYGLEMQDPDLLLIPVAKTKDGFGPKEYLERLGTASGSQHLAVHGSPLDQALPGGGDAPPDLLYQLTHRSLRLAREQSTFAAIRKTAGWDRFYDELIRHPVEMYRVAEAAQPSVDATFATPLTQLGGRLALESVAEVVRDRSMLEIVTNRGLLGQFIGGEPSPPTQEFLDTQHAVLQLARAELSDADYERLVGETLALCSTRFDAWQTSIATQRLVLLRKLRPTGLQIGSYGWLLNLPTYSERPFHQEPLVDRSAEDGPLVLPARQVGFVHAPSLAQAETASVLRAAELSHGDKLGSSVARLDLTSSRMRTATWVLGAVHNGQPLGAVLGYRLERALHDNGLSDIIDDIRAVFPQRSAPHPKDPDGADVQVVPHEVVDGERAWSAWKNGGINALDGNRGWVPEGGERATALVTVMQTLDVAVEAVADLLVAEGVHQIVSGNSPKAAATLNAVAHGDPPPPDFDVLRSPRNGVVLTNRVALALQDTGPVQGWDATAPRARLAPHLEAWAGRLLGDPLRWVAAMVVGTDEAQQPVSINLTSVPGLSALDVIHEATTMSGAQSVLAERLIAVADLPGAHVAQGSPLAAGELGWDQLVALAGAVRDLISGSRPLTSQDLLPPDAVPLSERYDLRLMSVSAIHDLENKGRSLVLIALVGTDLHIRIFDTSGEKVVDKAEHELVDGELLTALKQRLNPIPEESSLLHADKQRLIESATSIAGHTLSELMPAGEVSQAKATLDGLIMELKGVTEVLGTALLAEPPDVASARIALSKLVPFGVVGAAQPQRLDEASFKERAGAAVAAATRTLLAAETALALPDGTPDSAPSFGKLLAGARALFGPATMLTPLLPATPGLKENPLPADERVRAIDEWLTRLGRVRTSLSGLEDVRMFGTTLSLPPLPLHVTQLPLVAEDGWLGGTLQASALKNPLRSRHLPKQATTHLVLMSHEGLDPSAALAGLVLDEFSEVIPVESQTTGVGLHYNAPNARPPQSLLLAVHPDPTGADLPWSWPMIENMLIETLALAKLRTVELEQLAETAIDEYLPATYARDGMENMTPLHRISKDFFTLFGVDSRTAKANRDL